MTTEEVLDLEGLVEGAGGDEALARRLLARFQQDFPARLEQLRAALAAGDTEAAHRCAHSLKGSLATIRAHQAQEIARRLDEAARQGALAAARGELPALEAAAERLGAAIRERLAESA